MSPAHRRSGNTVSGCHSDIVGGSAKSHPDVAPSSKGQHLAATPHHHGISSPVASLPVGGSTVFTPANVSNTASAVVSDLGPVIAAGSVIGSRAPSSSFT